MTRMLASLGIVATVFCLLVPYGFCGGGHDHGHGHGNGDEHHEEEPPKGPNGGRLLVKDGFALEVTIFERGVPPEYRLFAYEDGKAIAPEAVKVSIKLTRFGDKIETFEFSHRDNFLVSPKVVEEPHSFLVSVTSEYKGEKHSWEFESFEGRTEFSDYALKVANLEIAVAGPIQISNSTRVYGRILPNEDRLAHLGPRFAGIVKDIRKSLGDQVEKGEVLAVIESNQNLQPYEVRSHINGVVIHRHATLGEVVSDSKDIFVVADLSQVWADFQVYRDDFGIIDVGQKIMIDLGPNHELLGAKVAYVSPITDEATQSKLIRAVLPNLKGDLRPGLFVSGILTASESPVAVAVKREAIQTFRDWNVVYQTDGHVFQAIPVELGRFDSEYIEITSGLEAGAKYVAKNSFIVKADIEKSGASHDH